MDLLDQHQAPQSDDDARSAAIAELEKGSQPAADNAPAPTEDAAPADAPKPWEPPEWSRFDYNGRQIFPDSPDKAATWLRQGYNYSQRMGEFNKTKAEQEARWREREEKWNKLQLYDAVEQYAQQNPDWWQHVQTSFQTRGKAQPGDGNAQIAALQAQLEDLTKFKTTWEQQQAQAEEQRYDSILQEEIASIRKQYAGKIDLGSTDGEGITLEKRILDHALASGIPTFKAAFHDFLAPQLLNHARAEGRQAVVAKQEQAAKAGLLGTSAQPPTKIAGPTSTRGVSYDQLAEQAKAALGL